MLNGRNISQVAWSRLSYRKMKTTVAHPGFLPSTTSKIGAWPMTALLLFFALLWFEVINQLKAEWWINPQYNYGLLVPLLVLYLIWKRWLERPSPVPADRRVWVIALMFLCALLFLPIRFVAEANPDWRLLSWIFAVVAVTMSILWIFIVGGWRWLRHFAFPFLFFLVAVPWPMRAEQIVVQDLMRLVTAINVELLNIAGVPALQHGNVIEVVSGLIGIEEACSGVRSLQATLMISLFLGELYSFAIGQRIFLVIAGGVLALVCNVARTAMLVWIGAKHGPKSIEAWHDPAGFTILLICLFGLWLLSLFMRRRSPASSPPSNIDSQRALLRFSWPLLVSLAFWFLVVETGVQIWYGRHQSIGSSRWVVQWPSSEGAYKAMSIPPEAENLLRYNEGGGAAWHGADGHPWMMYFFRWFPGRTAALFVKVHRPDICLPASGMTMERDRGLRLLAVNGVKLPIRSYRFDDHGAPLHVFYCYWDARSSYESVAQAEEEDWSPRGRLRAAWRGRREIGAQMLEVVVWGYEDDEKANEALQRQLAQIIRLG
jgi:exosortase